MAFITGATVGGLAIGVESAVAFDLRSSTAIAGTLLFTTGASFAGALLGSKQLKLTLPRTLTDGESIVLSGTVVGSHRGLENNPALNSVAVVFLGLLMALTGGAGTLEVLPRSVYAITTLDPGDLKYPERVTGGALDASALYETYPVVLRLVKRLTHGGRLSSTANDATQSVPSL